MAKKLRIRDKIILGLALAGDLYGEIFEPLNIQMKKLRGILPPNYKASNFYGSVSRMLTTNQIEKVVKDGEPYLRLGKEGEKHLVREFSFFKFSQQKWDGYWRMVFYDIAESERKTRINLQKKLKEIGFGKLQESVYVSPFDVVDDLREYLLELGLTDRVFVTASKRLLAGNEKMLAEMVWKLSDLNEQYAEWIGLLPRLRIQADLINAYEKYLDILSFDPYLPKELLPDDWLGYQAKEKVKSLLRYLMELKENNN